jgi:hypothetical protein
MQNDFSAESSLINGPTAWFSNMPLSKTLTMNLDVPEPWLVEPVIAMYVQNLIICSLCPFLELGIRKMVIPVKFSCSCEHYSFPI